MEYRFRHFGLQGSSQAFKFSKPLCVLPLGRRLAHPAPRRLAVVCLVGGSILLPQTPSSAQEITSQNPVSTNALRLSYHLNKRVKVFNDQFSKNWECSTRDQGQSWRES